MKLDPLIKTALLVGKISKEELSKVVLDKQGFSPNVLRTALYFVRKHTVGLNISKITQKEGEQVVTQCLKESFEFAGKANYCPVLVGPLLGVSNRSVMF